MLDTTSEGRPDASGVSRRQMLIGGSLLATAALAYAATPRRNVDLLGNGKLEALVPARIGNWTFLSKSGLVTPPSDQLSDLVYDQLLTRVYVGEDLPPMMLLIAQSPAQTGTIQVHRPEFCYPASGYRLSDSRTHPIDLPGRAPSLRTRMFTAVGQARTEQLLYWTRVGRELPTSWTEQRLAVARANFRGDIPDAMLVRVSTVGASAEASIGFLDAFARQLIVSMSPKGQTALIGASV
jgi:EpsI family protein